MKYTLISIATIFLVTNLFSQVPESFNYQAVVRNSNGSVIADQLVSIKISLLKGELNGSPVYVETFTPTTNQFGLINLEIGRGNVITGNFSSIEWSSDNYFIKIELDESGGTNYSEIGTNQLLSVPFAMHAKTVGKITETDPLFVSSIASGIEATDTSRWNNKLDFEIDSSVTNEIQNLSEVLYQGADAGGNTITNLANPINDQDVATKAYVDALENKLKEIGVLPNEIGDTGNVTDIEGNVYRTVRIGNQWWMAENLKTIFYQNGDTITDGSTVGDYSLELEPKYWFSYDDDLAEVDTFGRLYTWYVATDSRNVCPQGWHVPSDSAWNVMQISLGMSVEDANLICDDYNTIGGILKDTGTLVWQTPNTGATDEYGFTALPAGYRRRYYKDFEYKGEYACFWSTSAMDAENAWYRHLFHDKASICRTANLKNYGFSIRCVKDGD
jgi:uncharacterized protein (TIGR02145 family)